MKLYDAPKNVWVMPVEETHAPPDTRPVSVGEAVNFKHIDGMYSLCYDLHGNIVHLPAWQEVIVLDDPP